MATQIVKPHSASPEALTARSMALVSCHSCGLLCRNPAMPVVENKVADASKPTLLCPRCGAVLHLRKPNSIRRTWALVLAAYIFYIPANVLPITTVVYVGKAQSDTIMSGVIYFLSTGMWPIGLIIFIASVFVPLVKLIILTFLLISVQRKSTRQLKERTRLYRLTEIVGRWSMVDIYVVTLLVALVHLGNLATIYAGPGAVFFGAVVVITLFAAESFDPRILWDIKESSDEDNRT
ncbi:paraquat-inducible protein A [Desulfococcaceae bacterium HSG9]|nr:paraquat-inducible protein A [Desulfococcaceae bacterium HSG9]